MVLARPVIVETVPQQCTRSDYGRTTKSMVTGEIFTFTVKILEGVGLTNQVQQKQG
jgi:hypothetical protein